MPNATLAHAKGYSVPPEHAPRIVEMDQYFADGEIHVDPNFYALYLTLPDYKAWRYTVAVSQPALWEPGTYTLKWKAEWPRWRPTNAMIRRNPGKYAKYRNGMPGGPGNPLGARALYLFDGDRDTFLRIHGTTQPWTIGTASSNGCARMVNDHVIHLFDRVQKGARVVLHPRFDQVA
ncbi:L,D-transpeptidase [Lacimonas salitolerans]|uniref:L,D-transpeptidase n=1 Tax=Lacimonas salitolerans TaxID=1323750 RepID=A0ABW4ED24_9RHOB